MQAAHQQTGWALWQGTLLVLLLLLLGVLTGRWLVLGQPAPLRPRWFLGAPGERM
jgi:hypothetical protein